MHAIVLVLGNTSSQLCMVAWSDRSGRGLRCCEWAPAENTDSHLPPFSMHTCSPFSGPRRRHSTCRCRPGPCRCGPRWSGPARPSSGSRTAAGSRAERSRAGGCGTGEPWGPSWAEGHVAARAGPGAAPVHAARHVATSALAAAHGRGIAVADAASAAVFVFVATLAVLAAAWGESDAVFFRSFFLPFFFSTRDYIPEP